MDAFAALRERMVQTIAERGVDTLSVLEAMRSVPRHEFVPAHLMHSAYDDAPLPIGNGQTISQPYIVALMAQALKLSHSDTVLDVGTGSGYAAAVFSRLARHVYSVERLESLAHPAKSTLARLGYDNVFIRVGDGTQGWAEHAPFNAISVAAASDTVPAALVQQLAPCGRLLIPVGSQESQRLWRITVDAQGRPVREELSDVRFVPLVADTTKSLRGSKTDLLKRV